MPAHYQGDSRRCPTHPHIRTSSPCGLFDAPCGQCEWEIEEAYQKLLWEALSPEERQAITEENERFAQKQKERENKHNCLLDGDIPF